MIFWRRFLINAYRRKKCAPQRGFLFVSALLLGGCGSWANTRGGMSEAASFPAESTGSVDNDQVDVPEDLLGWTYEVNLEDVCEAKKQIDLAVRQAQELFEMFCASGSEYGGCGPQACLEEVVLSRSSATWRFSAELRASQSKQQGNPRGEAGSVHIEFSTSWVPSRRDLKLRCRAAPQQILNIRSHIQSGLLQAQGLSPLQQQLAHEAVSFPCAEEGIHLEDDLEHKPFEL